MNTQFMALCESLKLQIQRTYEQDVTIGVWGLSNSCLGASVGVYW